MSRKTKRDWLQVGVEILGQAGAQGITIDALCNRLQLTKGSFYHHFGSMEGYKLALLDHYAAEGTLDIIKQVEQVPTPEGQLVTLIDTALASYEQTPINAETMLRAWGMQDADVRAVLERVDAQRVAFVEGLCLQITGDPARASLIANTLYALLVGGEQLGRFSAETMRHMFHTQFQLFGIATEREKSR